MTTLELRVSLAGVLRNAADCLDALLADLLDARGIDPADEGAEGDPRDDHQPDYYASALREIARHARGLKAGVHAAADFARFYDLDPGPAGSPLTEADYCPLGDACR